MPAPAQPRAAIAKRKKSGLSSLVDVIFGLGWIAVVASVLLTVVPLLAFRDPRAYFSLVGVLCLPYALFFALVGTLVKLVSRIWNS